MALYLGREVDPATRVLGARVELDPRDLTTHGLIVGMTGSGKTGLAIALVEEALCAGIPVLAVDPKGDLGNLLLLFDGLDARSFAPWIDPDAARGAGQTPEQAAEAAAEQWSKGLAEWGLSADDVRAARAGREAVIYTPGSGAGVALNLLGSLAPPPFPFESAEEDLRDEIAGHVRALLQLTGLRADPVRSREGILVASLIEDAWRGGRAVTLESLVAAVADPPLEKLGALPIESVYPRADRLQLVLALNALLASPSFESWREGEPMDLDRLLRATDGRPRLSIVHTAHLGEEERLLVTALLLEKVKTWVRRQPGTSELRALVYMDEIYGYFPPHPADPPTKRPLLTLLKQARAQGLGIVLATQNPVDLDYKGLANMGVWLVGRLQTSRDRERLREGLLGSGGLDAAALDRLLDATGKRVFLLHDVHRPAPVLLHSRWALAYLRGPLTREEIARLTPEQREGAAASAARATTPDVPVSAAAAPPPMSAPLRHLYVAGAEGALARPYLLVKYAVRYKGAGETVGLKAFPLGGRTLTEGLEGEPLDVQEGVLTETPPGPLRHGDLPASVASATARALDRVIRDRLPARLAATIWHDPVTRSVSRPGEPATAFAERLRAEGGGAVAARLRERLERKRRDLAAAEEDLAGRRGEKWAAVGTAILSNIGLVTGRKRTVSGAGTVLSKNRMENAAEARIARLKAEVAALEAQLAERATVAPERFERRDLSPSARDVSVLRYDLLWA